MLVEVIIKMAGEKKERKREGKKEKGGKEGKRRRGRRKRRGKEVDIMYNRSIYISLEYE